MVYKIEKKTFDELISSSHFTNEGDFWEKKYWIHLKERFTNCEEFWRYFIIPLTKRIEIQDKNERERIRFREGIHSTLQDIAALHYSLFLNLAYSYNHLLNNRISAFEDFYIHLASTCDLSEEFILRIYINILRWGGKKSEVLEELSKDRFLCMASEWYDKYYLKVYENYLNKGKPPPFRLPSRKYVLDEYLGNAEMWREYKRHSQLIREYRNVIVHSAQIGRYIHRGIRHLVPKKEKIQQYKTWAKIREATKNIDIINSDFISMREQMVSDIIQLELLLNGLWGKVISDMKHLFLHNHNMLIDYNIDFTSASEK